jgi:putative oxidoreductase
MPAPEQSRWTPRVLSVVRVCTGVLFVQHGLEKVIGAPFGRPDHDFSQLHAWAGPIESIMGSLLILGLFTRFAAFIACGELAVAYFHSWAPRGLLPIANGGELAVLDCFLFLWLFTAGGGPWSLDTWIAARRQKALLTYRPAVQS